MVSATQKKDRGPAQTSDGQGLRGRAIALALEQAGNVTHEVLQGLAAEHEDLPEALLAQGLVTRDEMAEAVSLQMHVRLMDLKHRRASPEALGLIPEQTARRYRLIPLEILADSLVVVLEDPSDIEAIDVVGAQAAQAQLRLQLYAGLPSEVQAAIDLHYRSGEGEIEDQVKGFADHFSTFEEQADDGDADNRIEEAPVVKTLNLILHQAVRERASDVHIEPQQKRVRIRYRVDGVLRDAMSLPTSALDPLISRVKILAGMNITERRRPQGGQFSIQVGESAVDVRVATMDAAFGETAVLRILDKSLSLFSLPQLGFQAGVLRQYEKLLKSPFGMILSSGPTGSGKTTSLYASINQLDRDQANIMTIEDPVEYVFSNIKQIKVNEKAGVTFAAALRSFMRMDPDIILVGEIRDDDTAQTAIQAALTGHLVLSSIHANDAPSVPFRLMNLGVEPYLIASVLVGVVAQRMVRRLCSHCRTPIPGDGAEAEAAQMLGLEADEAFYGPGCNLCSHTGYLGRTGVFELLGFSEEVSRLFMAGAAASEIRSQAVQEGMVALLEDGVQKVRDGTTTPSEVLRNIFAAQSGLTGRGG